MKIIEKPLSSIKHSLSDVSMGKITGGRCSTYSGTCSTFDRCLNYDGTCHSFDSCHLFDVKPETVETC